WSSDVCSSDSGVVLWSRGPLFPPVACHSLRIGKRAYLGVDPCDESLLIQRDVGARRFVLLCPRDANVADRTTPAVFDIAAASAKTAPQQAAQDTLARGRAAVDAVEAHHPLGGVKSGLIDDRFVIAWEDALLPDCLACIRRIGEDPVHGTISPYL